VSTLTTVLPDRRVTIMWMASLSLHLFCVYYLWRHVDEVAGSGLHRVLKLIAEPEAGAAADDVDGALGQSPWWWAPERAPGLHVT